LAQSKIIDEFRGRVFAFYDVVVNFGIVVGAIIAAIVLPDSGISKLLPFLLAVVFLVYNLIILRKSKFSADFVATK